MRSVKRRNAAALILDLAMAALVAWAIGSFFSEAGRESGAGNMQTGGVGCLTFFTNDSNILAALGRLLLIPFHLRAIRSGRDALPGWALLFAFTGTVAVTVTLMVVLLFLGPLMGYAAMFEGSCLALHLICPLLAIGGFCFLDCGPAFSRRQALWGVAPTLVYGTVYLVNVVFRETWSDFYSFNWGGRWYISYVTLPAVTYLFALALRALHRRAEHALC